MGVADDPTLRILLGALESRQADRRSHRDDCIETALLIGSLLLLVILAIGLVRAIVAFF